MYHLVLVPMLATLSLCVPGASVASLVLYSLASWSRQAGQQPSPPCPVETVLTVWQGCTDPAGNTVRLVTPGDQLQFCRSYSVDSGHKPVLSRRQILACLEEENGSLRIPTSSPSLSSYTWSSLSPSASPANSENSFSAYPSTSEGVFSRACLIQSISREESASPR